MNCAVCGGTISEGRCTICLSPDRSPDTKEEDAMLSILKDAETHISELRAIREKLKQYRILREELGAAAIDILKAAIVMVPSVVPHVERLLADSPNG